ncbi:acyl-CoA N-acyltransferase [Lojkania enalia]|uniref:Acyl-CoA N-acyltransferase n=1 Tax=Lojkania enalia TaxID=147567 RepID=A0A9P4KFF3_9PLEO|nr:acyl-CoA N-acyltransferase [Didymosphaeria enalia]
MSVVVEMYNPRWPEYFQQIKSELEQLLINVDIRSIEHIGSTSVSELAARPIIDVDVVVTRDNVQTAIDALVSNGHFTCLGELGVEDRYALCDPNQPPERNIYVCVEGAFQTRNHLGLRDVLRVNAELREEYGAVKLGLAARGLDIADYVEAKNNIIHKILRTAGFVSEDELAAIEAASRERDRRIALQTDRLTLREFVLEDVPAFHALESIPEVVRYQTWPPKTLEDARKDVVQIIQNSFVDPRAHIELAVMLEDRFIGRVGAFINPEDSQGKPICPPHTDLWFSFMPEMQGKGFAVEATKAFIPTLGSPMTLEIECDPRNTGSWKLAERLGFERVRLIERAFECKGEWVGSLVYQKKV